MTFTLRFKDNIMPDHFGFIARVGGSFYYLVYDGKELKCYHNPNDKSKQAACQVYKFKATPTREMIKQAAKELLVSVSI